MASGNKGTTCPFANQQLTPKIKLKMKYTTVVVKGEVLRIEFILDENGIVIRAGETEALTTFYKDMKINCPDRIVAGDYLRLIPTENSINKEEQVMHLPVTDVSNWETRNEKERCHVCGRKAVHLMPVVKVKSLKGGHFRLTQQYAHIICPPKAT